MNMKTGFQSHHLKFLGNSHMQQWKLRAQVILEGSQYEGTSFGVKQAFCTLQLYFLGSLTFPSLSVLLYKMGTVPDCLVYGVSEERGDGEPGASGTIVAHILSKK